MVVQVSGCEAVSDVDVEVAFEHPASSQLQLVLSYAGTERRAVARRLERAHRPVRS